MAVISPSFGSSRANGVDCDTLPADGTVIWTASTGKTYKTLRGSRIFFPAWDTTTAALPKAAPVPQMPGRALMMPKRRRTRAAERTRRIRDERALNAAYVAQLAQAAATAVKPSNKHPPAEEPHIWNIDTTTRTGNDDPPPF